MMKNDELSVIKGPESISFKGLTWLYGKIQGDSFYGFFYISVQEDEVFIIAMMVNPPEKEEEVQEIFQKFLDTLSL